jgi:mannose-6-phosphate isomerase
MAASDNGFRAGLTARQVDTPELLEIANFTATPPPLWEGAPLGGKGWLEFSPPVDEFEPIVTELPEASF